MSPRTRAVVATFMLTLILVATLVGIRSRYNAAEETNSNPTTKVLVNVSVNSEGKRTPGEGYLTFDGAECINEPNPVPLENSFAYCELQSHKKLLGIYFFNIQSNETIPLIADMSEPLALSLPTGERAVLFAEILNGKSTLYKETKSGKKIPLLPTSNLPPNSTSN